MTIVITKTNNPVIVPLSSQARRWLPEPTAADDIVFKRLPNAGNLCVNLKSRAKKAGIKKKITFHTSRHTFGTLMLTLGADLYTTSKLFGHANVKTTTIYAKIIDRKKIDAVNLTDGVFD